MAAVPDISFVFQPMLSMRTGELVAIEALARPASGTVNELLTEAGRAGQVVAADTALAASALLAAASHEIAVPLHVNVLAITAARPVELLRLLDPALRRTGRRPEDVTLEISPPFCRATRLLAGLDTLRQHGFRIAFDRLGEGDLPLSLLVEAGPDMVKLDVRLLRGLPTNPAAVAVIEALAHVSARTGVRLGAVGVESEEQLLALSRLGVWVAQGNLLAPARRRVSAATLSRIVIEITEPAAVSATPGVSSAPRLADLLHPAATLPESATSEEVRTTFAESPGINGVVLVDEAGRPRGSLDRSRFLLAVTGPYGHALHARRPAARHADPPRAIHEDATALQLLEMVGDTGMERAGDDVVVVDTNRRCVGIVRLTEVIRVVAEAKIEQAVTLNPLTRLPGSDMVAREINRRIERDEMFVVAWLDVDSFKSVNDTAGFAAGDDLIRAIGRELAAAEATMPGTRVSHVGGDDFLTVTDLDEIAPLAGRLVDTAWDTEGVPVTVSLASLVCGVQSVRSYREASRLLAPLKKRAKAVAGSSWVLGRPESDRVHVLRGRSGNHIRATG